VDSGAEKALIRGKRQRTSISSSSKTKLDSGDFKLLVASHDLLRASSFIVSLDSVFFYRLAQQKLK